MACLFRNPLASPTQRAMDCSSSRQRIRTVRSQESRGGGGGGGGGERWLVEWSFERIHELKPAPPRELGQCFVAARETAGTVGAGQPRGLSVRAMPRSRTMSSMRLTSSALTKVSVGVGKAEIGEDVAAAALHGGVGGVHGVSLRDACHGSAARRRTGSSSCFRAAAPASEPGAADREPRAALHRVGDALRIRLARTHPFDQLQHVTVDSALIWGFAMVGKARSARVSARRGRRARASPRAWTGRRWRFGVRSAYDGAGRSGEGR